MTLTLPLGRHALSVELRVKSNQGRTARSGVYSNGGRENEFRPLYGSTDRSGSAAVDARRAEAFLQLVNSKLM